MLRSEYNNIMKGGKYEENIKLTVAINSLDFLIRFGEKNQIQFRKEF